MKYLQSLNEKYKHLKVIVDSGGCSGYQYFLEMCDSIDEEDDIIFERNGMKVLADKLTLSFISGATIDYREEMIRSAF